MELLKVPTAKEALVAHRKAKLTPLGRLLLVERIERLGWPVQAAAESMGVSVATAYKWRRRFLLPGTSLRHLGTPAALQIFSAGCALAG